MVNWKEIFEALGLGTPFYYAITTFFILNWLDKKASGQAKKAISEWLQPKPYNREAVSDAIIEIFDRIYTRPLFAWRAFWRSALITSGVLAVFVYELLPWKDVVEADLLDHLVFWVSLLTSIISDYVALFIVRRFLVLGRTRPVIALILAPLSGMFVILAVFFVRGVAQTITMWWIVWQPPRPDLIAIMLAFSSALLIPRLDMSWYWMFFGAALLVHLWLPLFGLSVAFLRGLNYFRAAVGWTQWFIKQGEVHPFQSIGYVAAAFVFAVTGIAQWVRLAT